MRNIRILICIASFSLISLLFLMLSACGTPSGREDQPQSEEAQTKEEIPASSKKADPPPPPPVRKAAFAAGTPITVVTSSTLSTKTNQTGEPFQASLNHDLVDGDWVVARKGAAVTGIISDSDPGGRVKGVASITVQLKKLILADGREISISTNSFSATAQSSKKKDAARIGIGAGVGAAVGAIAGGGKGAAIGAGVGGAAGTGATLATRGDPASIPSETPINFELAAPLEITEHK